MDFHRSSKKYYEACSDKTGAFVFFSDARLPLWQYCDNESLLASPIFFELKYYFYIRKKEVGIKYEIKIYWFSLETSNQFYLKINEVTNG